MHVPDGFVDLPVSTAAAVVSAGAIGWALRRSRRTWDDSVGPMTGMVAVFVFAAQMINFPVGAGTSGHLMGAALAAILVGPWAAMLAMTVVVGVQALVFADGGLLALGVNLLNLAVIAPLVGWTVFRVVVRLFGDGRRVVSIGAGLAGLFAVMASAVAFSAEFALGGTSAVDPATVTVAMVGVHAVIGIVEGVVTAMIVLAVLSLRADLVAGLPRRVTDQAPQAADAPTDEAALPTPAVVSGRQ